MRSADGTAGHQFRFGRDEGQHPYDYWITVFVTADRLFLVEAGDRTTGRWCHETTSSRETVVCLVEEATGVAFFVANPDVTLPGFRECTAEREPVACATP